MAYNPLLRRLSSSLVPLTVRAVGSARPMRGAISAVRSVEEGQLRRELHRSSLVWSLNFSTATDKEQGCDDDYLLRIIDSEIKCAEESNDHYHVEEIPHRFPFKIKDNPGKRVVVLRRVHKNETVEVEVNLPNFGIGNSCEGDEENSNQPSIPLVVNVLKGRRLCLQFSVTAFPDEIFIDSLSIKDPQNSEDQLGFGGPEFSDLDEKLQTAFLKYLETRGIEPSTINFLYEYMISKDSKEYLQWLKKIKEFVER